MNKGFSSLGELLKVKNDATCDYNTLQFPTTSRIDYHMHSGGSDVHGISDIFDQLEKEFNVSEQNGMETILSKTY